MHSIYFCMKEMNWLKLGLSYQKYINNIKMRMDFYILAIVNIIPFDNFLQILQIISKIFIN
jgi:hypothetical protein